MLSEAKCRSLLEDLAVIGTKHLLVFIEGKQKADPLLPLRMTCALLQQPLASPSIPSLSGSCRPCSAFASRLRNAEAEKPTREP
jgi:hypothetical protein